MSEKKTPKKTEENTCPNIEYLPKRQKDQSITSRFLSTTKTITKTAIVTEILENIKKDYDLRVALHSFSFNQEKIGEIECLNKNLINSINCYQNKERLKKVRHDEFRSILYDISTTINGMIPAFKRDLRF